MLSGWPFLALWLALQIPATDGVSPVPARTPAASSPAEILLAANLSYEQGRYGEAVDGYSRLLSAGHDHPLLQYNLGNALLRAGELGRAIATYRRAQRGQPRNQDIRANLEFARLSARDDLLPPAPSALLETLVFWHYHLSRRESWIALTMANLFLWCLLTGRLLGFGGETARVLIVVTAMVVAATGSSLAVAAVVPQRIAVIVPPEVAVHSGVSTETLVRFNLHAGSEIRVVEERNGWLRISLPDGQRGWLESRHSEMLTR